MLRLAARLLALSALTTAALVPGAAVFSRASAQVCPGAPTGAELVLLLRESPLIVLGTVKAVGSDAGADRGWLDLAPEAYLKGNPNNVDVRLITSLPDPCRSMTLSVAIGARILVIAQQTPDGLAWPSSRAVYVLVDGRARSLNKGDVSDLPEASLIARIRAETNQYSVPAATSDEGADIDWVKTVLPVGGAIAGLMVVSLLLMRVWHRIDPS